MTGLREIGPRRALPTGLLGGAAVLAVAVLAIAARALSAGTLSARAGYVGSAAVVALVGVVAPALLARAILRTRIAIDGEEVTRLVGGDVVARMRMSEVEQVRVGWQHAPGVMGRRPVVTLLGPTGGAARGIAANGLLLDDVRPLLALAAAEVARRPDVLASDRATYDDVVARLG